MATGATPVAVTARELPKKRPEFFRDVEETIEWTMEFASGAKGEFSTSYNGGLDRFRAEAEKGWFELAPAFQYGGLKGATSKGPLNLTVPPSQQAVQMDDFAQCILDNRPTSLPGEEGLRDVKILMAIYEAARTGKAVSLV